MFFRTSMTIQAHFGVLNLLEKVHSKQCTGFYTAGDLFP